MEIEIIKKKSEVPMVNELKLGEVFQFVSGCVGVRLNDEMALIAQGDNGENALYATSINGFVRPARILGRMVGIKVEPQ